MNTLMNVNSKELLSSNGWRVQVGDLIHAKAPKITDFGMTLKVTKVTKCQIIATIENLWFPVFDETAFGRIAHGENPDRVNHLKELESNLKGKERRFWKETGFEVSGSRALVMKLEEQI